jgi:hypothetical protein
MDDGKSEATGGVICAGGRFPEIAGRGRGVTRIDFAVAHQAVDRAIQQIVTMSASRRPVVKDITRFVPQSDANALPPCSVARVLHRGALILTMGALPFETLKPTNPMLRRDLGIFIPDENRSKSPERIYFIKVCVK